MATAKAWLGVSVLVLGGVGADAEEKAANGFHYDARTRQYFTNEKSAFSIRPVGGATYLERIDVSIDNGDYQAYSGKLQFSAEGLHLIQFRAVDPVLNWTPVQTFRVHVDMTPPQTEPLWEGATHLREGMLYVHPASRLALDAQDGLSGVAKILVGEGEKARPYAGPVSFGGEGAHVVRYSAIDNVGNRETWKEIRFAVDRGAPISAAEVRGKAHRRGENLFVGADGLVVLRAEDTGSGPRTIEYQFDGADRAVYSQPIVIAGNQARLRYRAVDHVGNEEAWKSVAVHRDTTPPRVALQRQGAHVASSGKVYAKPGFVLKAAVEDAESGVQDVLLTRDGKNFEKADRTEIRFDQPGEYSVTFRAVDHVGNLTDAEPQTVAIDSAPPRSEISSAKDLLSRDGVYLSGLPNRIEVRARDEGAGVERVEVSFDGKAFAPYTAPLDLATWSQPERTLYYRGVDRLGNQEEVRSIKVLVLARGPAVELFVEAENLPEVPLSVLLRRNQAPAERQPASPPEKK